MTEERKRLEAAVKKAAAMPRTETEDGKTVRAVPVVEVRVGDLLALNGVDNPHAEAMSRQAKLIIENHTAAARVQNDTDEKPAARLVRVQADQLADALGAQIAPAKPKPPEPKPKPKPKKS